jgi:hypothetical protein
MTIDTSPLRGEDSAPPERTLRDHIEGMSSVRGLLFGAALATPFWLCAGAALAAWSAVSR